MGNVFSSLLSGSECSPPDDNGMAEQQANNKRRRHLEESGTIQYLLKYFVPEPRGEYAIENGVGVTYWPTCESAR